MYKSASALCTSCTKKNEKIWQILRGFLAKKHRKAGSEKAVFVWMLDIAVQRLQSNSEYVILILERVFRPFESLRERRSDHEKGYL